MRAVRDAGLELSGYCRGGMFTSDAAHRIEVRDDNRRAVDEAKALGAPCIVLVVGGLPQYSRPGSAASKDIAGARAQVDDAIAEMMDYARTAQMPLAIEPLHPAYAADRACVNTTKQALDICDRLDPQRTGALGVALDVYHIWWDPELLPQIARAGKDRLLAFHVCDWLVPTKDILNDRGMMGDGVIDIKSVRGAVEAQGFAGYSEIEIFSNDWWDKADGRGVADLHRAAPFGGIGNVTATASKRASSLIDRKRSAAWYGRAAAVCSCRHRIAAGRPSSGLRRVQGRRAIGVQLRGRLEQLPSRDRPCSASLVAYVIYPTLTNGCRAACVASS